MSAEVSPGTDALAAAGQTRGIFPAELLDRCISCGFCLPACPTYAQSLDEASSPRGRITLMRALETGVLDDDDATLREQASYCLGCRACEPVCPAGVQYGELLEHWRSHQWQGRRRPPLARVLTNVVVRNWLVRRLGLFSRHARTATAAPQGPHLMLGCFERALFPAVSRAARRLRPELDAPGDQGCCGALHAHNGDLELGRELGRRLGEQLPGTIVTTAGGCAAHLASVLGRDRVKEFSEYAAADPATALGELRVDGRRARVALQDSCHLRNGMDVWREPRELIAAVADYVELPGAAQCCGSAGSYSLLRPRDSRRVLAPKLDQIEAAGVDYVVAVNPGCQRQLVGGLRRRRSRVRVLHLTELLAAAQDGGLPRRRLRLGLRSGRRAEVPADEPAGTAAHLNDRPLPDDPGAAAAGRPDALDGSAGPDDIR
ncbi:glycolate oxidase iron-sulfur subunit [Geodermatophilus pulveris]|uniref:Glycolate oxidase iron-sulfur subunit n=1 Tax=Geodermatophilus pulveris TaxID=1564159 RepID=A0A239J0G0_9ACTN|nr:(Fe-S)-binding protein [Geodermatophilus pulveris]SNS99357.1 glycolate oxidase iron-sulfur subunit [Geodermatophilus pulveris]